MSLKTKDKQEDDSYKNTLINCQIPIHRSGRRQRKDLRHGRGRGLGPLPRHRRKLRPGGRPLGHRRRNELLPILAVLCGSNGKF